MTTVDDAVLNFVRDELRCEALDIDSSLSTGKYLTVAEDVYELVDKYVEAFGVDCHSMDWRRYFPGLILPFLPNPLLPAILRLAAMTQKFAAKPARLCKKPSDWPETLGSEPSRLPATMFITNPVIRPLPIILLKDCRGRWISRPPAR